MCDDDEGSRVARVPRVFTVRQMGRAAAELGSHKQRKLLESGERYNP
jgi:hypothetical protein